MGQQQNIREALAAFGSVARRARASHVVTMRDLEAGLVAYRSAIRANRDDTVGGCLDRVVGPIIDNVLVRYRAQPHPQALKNAVGTISQKTLGVVATVAVLDGGCRGVALDEAASRGVGTLLDYVSPTTLSELTGKSVGVPRPRRIDRGGADL